VKVGFGFGVRIVPIQIGPIGFGVVIKVGKVKKVGVGVVSESCQRWSRNRTDRSRLHKWKSGSGSG
jgi:hypothetical protein